uniref:tRNA-dihydrouridine(16/17) synthase [NAD(P)(+)]-like n=1 Tax=Phallusia mammillata TaxID=59560 RepID=A0A6F9DC81_9ASCI|nr:tRNA-dihydrouridine(16/17) synthase [NAD(P)(+)]-like [Phallusia mammillata]
MSEENRDVKKLKGFEFWEKTLQKAKLVVAPMVDQSELAWRMLSRKYGAQLCYTPMLHSSVFIRDPQYRLDGLASCDEDRPLIVQFCGNKPETILEACLLAQDKCDAVDLNLGCPQMIAKRGNYGAFLGEKWELVEKIVKTCNEKLSVPITCKIRVFTDIEKTVAYAKMLERAGCQLLTVHGRTKEMKGPKTGIASWKHIKAVKDAVKIPVYANGNIQYKEDVDRCIKDLKVEGVMTAEGNLHNPAIFMGQQPITWEISSEYLDLVEKYPCPMSYVRGHLFKICHHGLQKHTNARDVLAGSKDLKDMRRSLDILRETCKKVCWGENGVTEGLPHPHWICQPYVRPPPKPDPSRVKVTPPTSPDIGEVSRKKMKKLLKRCRNASELSLENLNPNEKAAKLAECIAQRQANKPVYTKCVRCGNPSGKNCIFISCKRCCKDRARELEKFCQTHRNFTPQANCKDNVNS